jgi:molecular chaperone GrpE
MPKKKKKHITKTKKKLNSNELNLVKNQLTRVLADYDNLQKRIDREKLALVTMAGLSLVSRLLPVLDMLEKAQEHLGDPGLAIAIGQFIDILKEEGVVQIQAKEGDEFNEEYVEAVEVIEPKDKNESGKVEEIVSTGWKYEDGHIVRPVRVKVYKN